MSLLRHIVFVFFKMCDSFSQLILVTIGINFGMLQLASILVCCLFAGSGASSTLSDDKLTAGTLLFCISDNFVCHTCLSRTSWGRRCSPSQAYNSCRGVPLLRKGPKV